MSRRRMGEIKHSARKRAAWAKRRPWVYDRKGPTIHTTVARGPRGYLATACVAGPDYARGNHVGAGRCSNGKGRSPTAALANAVKSVTKKFPSFKRSR